MGTLITPKQTQDMLDITAKVLDTACLPLDIAKMLSDYDANKDIDGAVVGLVNSLGDIASIFGKEIFGLSASAFSLEKGISDAKNELKHNDLSASTLTSIFSDMASIAAVAIAAGSMTPLAVVFATGGLLLSALSYNLGYEKNKAKRDFAKFSEYLKSNEAREYLNCPNCLNIEISNPTVYENDGIANFTITLSKPLNENIRLRLFTVQGSATQDKDYIGIEKKNIVYVEIPAGTTEYTQPISIVRDGKYEGQEDFLLVVDDIHYTGADVSHIINKDGVAVGLGTIIDIEQDKCPKPTTPTFSLNFPLPSSPSVYYPVYGSGGGSSGGSLPIYGGGSSGSSSTSTTPTYVPQPDIPYIPCPDNLIENNSALVMKLNNTNSNDEIANSNSGFFANAHNDEVVANNNTSNSIGHSKRSEESLNSNSNNANNANLNNNANTGLPRNADAFLAMTNETNSNRFANLNSNYQI